MEVNRNVAGLEIQMEASPHLLELITDAQEAVLGARRKKSRRQRLTWEDKEGNERETATRW